MTLMDIFMTAPFVIFGLLGFVGLPVLVWIIEGWKAGTGVAGAILLIIWLCVASDYHTS